MIQGAKQGPRILLLHGWLQSMNMWHRTAPSLCALYGASVLMIDWPAHGYSGELEDINDHDVESFLDCLEEILARVDWNVGSKIVIAGASMGGALAAKYAYRHPDRVHHLALICSAGMSESGQMSIAPTGQAILAFLASLGVFIDTSLRALKLSLPTFFFRRFANCQIAKYTPTFGLKQDVADRLRRERVSVALIWGVMDLVHTPQLQKWAGKRQLAKIPFRRSFPSRPDPSKGEYYFLHEEEVVWVWKSICRTHETMCAFLDSAYLDRYPELWGLRKGIRDVSVNRSKL